MRSFVAGLLAIAILTAFCPTSNVKAFESKEKLTERYRNHTTWVLMALKDMGIKHIACDLFDEKLETCFSPEDLLEVLSKAEFIKVFSFEKPFGATRWTAFYDPKNYKIYLNKSGEHGASYLGFIGLHEILGLVGVRESEFSISIAAYHLIYSSMNGLSLTAGQMKGLKNTLRWGHSYSETRLDMLNNSLSVGGVTVVGGAGDSRALEQRILFSNYLLNSISQNNASLGIFDYIPFSIQVPIEITDGKEGDEIIYRKNLGKTSAWPEHILVPRHLTLTPPLNKNSTAPNRAIEDIAHYLSPLLPKGILPEFQPTLYSNFFSYMKFTSFWYPDSLDALHPALKNYYDLLWKENCPSLESCSKISSNGRGVL